MSKKENPRMSTNELNEHEMDILDELCGFLHLIEHRLTKRRFNNVKIFLILSIVKYDVGENDAERKKEGLKILDEARYSYRRYLT